MYSYRSKAAVSELHKESEKIFKGLALRRQLLSQIVSTVRTLTARRNDQIAQALEDGLTVAKIAALTGESAWTIRTIGLSYEGLYPSRTRRDEHFDAIGSISAGLAAAEGKRALLEEQRERLVVRAYQVTDCDVLDLAMVSGMTLEQVHKATRGLSPRSSKDDRPQRPAALHEQSSDAQLRDSPARELRNESKAMQIVRTVSLPDAELLANLMPLPEGLEAVVWDMVSEPDNIAPGGIDAVVLPYLNASDVLGALGKVKGLKFVQTQSTGYDGVAEAAGPSAGVANAAGVHAAATAELAVGLILAKLRGIDQAVRDQQSRLWRPERRRSLADRRVLLAGVGGIGHEIFRRLEPFEVTVTRVGSSAREDEYGTVHAVSELAALAAEHDILVTVLPLNDATHHLIDEKILAELPDGALVVNVGRGAVVDTDALTREVVSGRLHCALDVVDPEPLPEDHPLWASVNALITPHVGGNASAFEPRIIKLLKEQLEALADGRTPKNLVQQGPFKGASTP